MFFDIDDDDPNGWSFGAMVVLVAAVVVLALFPPGCASHSKWTTTGPQTPIHGRAMNHIGPASPPDSTSAAKSSARSAGGLATIAFIDLSRDRPASTPANYAPPFGGTVMKSPRYGLILNQPWGINVRAILPDSLFNAINIPDEYRALRH